MQNNEMNKLFAEGGMMDDSGEVVNGVEVPTGSLASEVTDDIPAQLSEGEFVIPADVVRYIGLEKLMAIRDKAKQGLSRMEEMGQMGNADQVNNPDQTFAEEDGEYEDDDFEGNIDSIMAEDVGEEVKMAAGGYMTGADLSKAPKNSAINVRYFKHPDGRRIYITYINNRPMTAIPEGFTETDDIVEQQVGKAAEEKADAAGTITAGSGGDGGVPLSDPASSTFEQRQSLMIDIDPKTGKATAKAIPDLAKALALFTGPLGIAGAAIYKTMASSDAKQWNDALSKGNVIQTNTLDPLSEDTTPAWINVTGVKDTGMGSTSRGTSVSTLDTTRMQDEQNFGGYFDSSGNFVETDKATAAKSATTPVSSGGGGSSSSTPTYTPPAPTSNPNVYSSSSSGYESSGDGGGYSGDFSGADAGGDGFGPSSAGGMAKGGMVTKRNKQPKKPIKGKGLAASKK